MKRWLQRVVIAAVMAAPTTQALELKPFKAELEAIRYGAIDLSTEGSLQLKQDGQRWHYALKTDGRTINLHEQVWFTVHNNRIHPQRYAFESRAFWIKNEKKLRFDHDARRVTGTVEDHRVDIRYKPPLYDAIGYQLALQQRLLEGQRQIELSVMRHKKPDQFSFRVIGEEQLSLPGGEVYTWIVEQTEPVSDNERKLIWVAPEWSFVPLRFGRYKDGKLKEEIRALSLSLDGRPLTFD